MKYILVNRTFKVPKKEEAIFRYHLKFIERYAGYKSEEDWIEVEVEGEVYRKRLEKDKSE